ncbi:ribonuclease H-like domain-containing protein [Rhizophagus irregularis DAOM 181602=DAOM 197198]|nr:ribonuclease H-like domain-containing protein [Rhizophagus irregularis DAOM 181602=DAOM 197198]
MSNLQNNQGQGQPPNRFNQAPQVNQADIQALTAAVQALTGQMLAPNNLGNAMNTLNATVAANNNALQNRNHNVAQVPTFNGGNQDPITWLNEFNATATANGWNDARKLQVVPAYLKGPAAVWYQAAVLAPIKAWAAAANVNNFEHAFLTRVDEYASSIQELYQRVNDAAFAYPDNLQARKFVSGLQPELYMAVKPFGDQTLADAIGRAKGCELTLRSGKTKLLNYTGQTTSEITELTKLVAALTEQITEIGKKVTGNRPPPRSDSRNPNVPSGPNRTIVCYTCGEAGHVSRRCPNNATNTSVTNPVIAPVVTTTPPTSATNDTQSLVQELLKHGASAGGVDAKPDKSSISLNTLFEAYPAQRRSQMRRAEPYSRPVVSEEEESSQPLDIPTAPIDIPKTVEPMIVTETAETSSKAIERTTVNIAAKKKKAPVVKKKKKMNLQPLISLHVPPYSMVDDIKNQQARITFGQLLEVAPKCRSELIRGIRKPTVRKMNLGEQETEDTATALYCDATVKGTEILLIIDSGAAGSIVSCQLLKDLKIPIDRPSTTMMINVNGERKRPLGEVLNFPITIQDITVPINVVVTEAESYAAIVGNDWLSKVRANIDYESSTMNLTWNKRTIGVPVEYRLMPQEKRKLQGLIDSSSPPKEDDDGSEKEDTDEEETDDDSIKEEEEEFEDDEPEERVFFTMQFEKPRRPTRIRYRNNKKKAEVRKRDPLPESSVILDCKFANVVIDAIYPCEDFVLTNEGIYLGKCFHTWGHLQHLNQKFKTTPPKKATWVYDWKGPKAKCWCRNSLYSPVSPPSATRR